MGKATIISGGDQGAYVASVRYRTDTIEAQEAILEARKAEYEADIPGMEDGREKNLLKAQLLGVQKRLDYLANATPKDFNINVWCADLTDDLSGDVGLIEVPGQTQDFNIHPGHGGAGGYILDRDGFIMPTAGLTAAQAYANLGLLPAWQKWKPTFRYGVITSLSGDVCDIALEAATSTQQGINVNQGTTLSGVPIEYMDCNGVAFESGDSVLIKFTGQDFNTPRVIGFKDNPKPCGYDFFIKPVFNGHDPTKGNQTLKVAITVEGELIEATGIVYGENNPAPDPVLDGLADFRGAGVPGTITDPEYDTSVYLKSAGAMGAIAAGTDPEYIADLSYMAGFTFLHYYASTSADYDFKWDGVYFKAVEYKTGDYFILGASVSTVEVDGTEYDVYEMDFSDLSTLLQQPNAAALENTNAWVKSIPSGPGLYGPWLDNRYGYAYYYATAWNKAKDYTIAPGPGFHYQTLDDWLYGNCVDNEGWYAQLRELNVAAQDSFGGNGVIQNLPAAAFAILSNPDGSSPTFTSYSVSRSGGTYRFYYLQDCLNEGQPVQPEVGGEDYNPYNYGWGYSMVETPPELW